MLATITSTRSYYFSTHGCSRLSSTGAVSLEELLACAAAACLARISKKLAMMVIVWRDVKSLLPHTMQAAWKTRLDALVKVALGPSPQCHLQVQVPSSIKILRIYHTFPFEPDDNFLFARTLQSISRLGTQLDQCDRPSPSPQAATLSARRRHISMHITVSHMRPGPRSSILMIYIPCFIANSKTFTFAGKPSRSFSFSND